MLKPIKLLLEKPEDIPNVPRSVKEYLQSRFNHTYFIESGQWGQLVSQGFSEQFVAGVVHGLMLAARTFDDMEAAREAYSEMENTK